MNGAKGRSVIKNPQAPSCLLGHGGLIGAGAARDMPPPMAAGQASRGA